MIRLQRMTRLLAPMVLVTAAFAVPACHSSSGNNSPTATGPVASFTPDTPSPGAGQIVMLAGSTAGATIAVRVTITGVNGFFGSAFRVHYNTATLLFNDMTDATSVLRTGGISDSNLLFSENHTTTPGEIVITASRLDPTVAPGIDVTSTVDIVQLSFTARVAIAAGAAEGRVDFAGPEEIQTCDTAGTGNCSIFTPTAWSGGGVSTQ